MKKTMIPAEVIAHFDENGRITPCRIRFEKDGIKILHISKLVKRDVNMFAGNQIEIYECCALQENREIIFVLNFEKRQSKWFLSKL